MDTTKIEQENQNSLENNGIQMQETEELPQVNQITWPKEVMEKIADIERQYQETVEKINV